MTAQDIVCSTLLTSVGHFFVGVVFLSYFLPAPGYSIGAIHFTK